MAGKRVRNWFQGISQRFAGGKSQSDLKDDPQDRVKPDRQSSRSQSVNLPVATATDSERSAKVSPINPFPDFTRHGYQVLQALGHNYGGGRATYLATCTKTQQPAVIKQFQFAKPGADWSAYKAHEREIQVLQSLSHPGIPRYLDSFETSEGFCLVHEYKNARSLAVPRRLSPEKVKDIAIAVLEILVYLQNRIPTVIHRDIKPENILLSDRFDVYLIDFGFARIGGGDVVQSSVVSGTPGFMPPEQLLNLKLTEASDLYGLGATLLCLLTQTNSTEITHLIDSSYRINFADLVPHLSDDFIQWLGKMVEPNTGDRFADASAALEAIAPIAVSRTLPEVELSQTRFEFTGKTEETLTQAIAIKNPIPHTRLQAYWEISPISNTSEEKPEWIAIKPAKFSKNETECTITIDATNLVAGQAYQCNLLLHSNSATPTQIIPVSVQVEPLEIAIAETAELAKPLRRFLLPGVVFAVSLTAPFMLISPYTAVAIVIPLAILCTRDFSDKIQDPGIAKVADFSQKWLVAPSLAGLGIWFLSELDIAWFEHPERKLLAIALILLAMGGIGIGVLEGFKAGFKRLAVLLPIVIFATSFTAIGLTAGIAGKIAEVGVTGLVLSSAAKQEIQQKSYGIGAIIGRFGLTATLGIGLGTGLLGLLVHYGIASLLW